MAQLPPAPAGVDLSSAEQYIVPQPSDVELDHVSWVVESGWYWLIQSLVYSLAPVSLEGDGASPSVFVTDADGNMIVAAGGSQMINAEISETGGWAQAAPGIGADGTAVIMGLIPLPELWLPPGATISGQIIGAAGGAINGFWLPAALTVTRAQYTGSSQSSAPDDLPLATPALP